MKLLRGDRWLMVLVAVVVATAGTFIGVVTWKEIRGCPAPAERLSEFPQAAVDPAPRVALSVTVGENSPASAFEADAVVMGGVAVVSYRGVIAGFGLKTGKPLWQRDLNEDRKHLCDSNTGRVETPTIKLAASSAGLVVLDSDVRLPETLVHVLDPKTGQERGKFTLDGIFETPCEAIAKKTLICFHDDGYGGYDISSGKSLWTHPDEGWYDLTLSRVDQEPILYAADASKVRRLDLRTGEELPPFELQTDSAGKEIVVARNGRVVVSLEDGSVVALSTETGERVWHHDGGTAVSLVIDGPSYVSPPYDYINDKNEGEAGAVDIVAYGLRSGKVLWHKQHVSTENLDTSDFNRGVPVTASPGRGFRLWNLTNGKSTRVLRRFEVVAPAYGSGVFTVGSDGSLAPFLVCEGRHKVFSSEEQHGATPGPRDEPSFEQEESHPGDPDDVTPDDGETNADAEEPSSPALCEKRRLLLLDTSARGESAG